MVGRATYENTWLVSDFDRRFFGKENPGLTRREILIVNNNNKNRHYYN